MAARQCRAKVGFATFDEAAEAFRPRLACPCCGSPRTAKDGRMLAGRQRFHCNACGAGFAFLTGTVFEYGKKDLATWVRFVELMTWNVPIEAAAELCDVTHKPPSSGATVCSRRSKAVRIASCSAPCMDRRGLYQRHRPLQGLRAEAVYRGRHRRLE